MHFQYINYAIRPIRHLLPTLMSFLVVLTFTACQGDTASTKQSPTSKKVSGDIPTPTKTDKKVILFFGDSLTAGYELDEEDAFPSLIEDKIDSLGLDYTVINAGLSGETTSGGLQRIDWIMKQKVDIFFLELGANDMLRGLPLEETRKNLSKIIATVQAKNPTAKIALCEMVALPNLGEDYGQAFARIFQDLSAPADIQHVPFLLDGVAGHPDLLLKDGLHPNAAGQIIVADNIWKVLEGML
jgi:acyl-CoA thioesterase-1